MENVTVHLCSPTTGHQCGEEQEGARSPSSPAPGMSEEAGTVPYGPRGRAFGATLCTPGTFYRGRSCSCSWFSLLLLLLWLLAAPRAHACNHASPGPLPHAQDGLLPPIPGRQSSSPHCTRIPRVPMYPRVHSHTAHTHWLRPPPRRSISHATGPKTDRASSRFLSLTDACPLGTARARASLLPRLTDAGSDPSDTSPRCAAQRA